MDEVRQIPVSDIMEPRSLLRLVDRNAIEYLELRDSIEKWGFTSSISVRPAKDKPGKFEIIGGVTRYTIAKELGLETMPCIIKLGITDDELLILQLQENAQRVETKAVEYARQIKAILSRCPDMDIRQLAVRIKKSPTWISQLLGLLKLSKDIQKLVDAGVIPVRVGSLLSQMPVRLQLENLPHAKAMRQDQFTQHAGIVIKQYKEALAHGRLEEFYTREFTPTPYLRHLKEIQAEMAHHQAGPAILASLDCKSPLDGFYAACQWFIHLNPESITAQHDAAKARQRKQMEEPLDDELT